MSIRPNWGLLKEVDELLDRAKKLRERIDRLCLKDPAIACWNCGCNKWVGEYCFNCGEHWRGKG